MRHGMDDSAGLRASASPTPAILLRKLAFRHEPHYRSIFLKETRISPRALFSSRLDLPSVLLRQKFDRPMLLFRLWIPLWFQNEGQNQAAKTCYPLQRRRFNSVPGHHIFNELGEIVKPPSAAKRPSS
jgi:hypothetical protein